MSIAPLKQWQKGYIAGALDSDGMINIRRNGYSCGFVCTVSFAGDLVQMTKIADMLKTGSLLNRANKNFTLYIGRKEDAILLLKKLYPYLTKKKEAELVFKMTSLHKLNSGRPSWENVQQRIKLFKEYKNCKIKSGGHTTNWGEFDESLRLAYYGNVEPSSNNIREGVETSPEIMDGSAPPEREDIVRT